MHPLRIPLQPAPPQEFGGLRYWFREAPGDVGAAPLMVAVHGVRRRPQQLLEAFAPFAARQGCHLLVPWFDTPAHADYQRLGRPGRGPRADLLLIALVEMLALRHVLRDEGLFLFGHSAGAQFVHRFVLAHPDRVHRYALGAAGWYTMPDAQFEFPLGTRHALPGFPAMCAERFLRVPGRVFVGERERSAGATLRRTAWLDEVQGTDRLQRAERWVDAMAGAAALRGLPPPVQLVRLADAAHSFGGLVRRARLVHHVWRFLFDVCPCGCSPVPGFHEGSHRAVRPANDAAWLQPR